MPSWLVTDHGYTPIDIMAETAALHARTAIVIARARLSRLESQRRRAEARVTRDVIAQWNAVHRKAVDSTH
jgi:hypothetical protein